MILKYLNKECSLNEVLNYFNAFVYYEKLPDTIVGFTNLYKNTYLIILNEKL